VLFRSLSVWLCAAYVRRRRVDTTPRSWTPKRIMLSVLSGLPFVIFVIGAMYVSNPESGAWRGAIVGAAIGGAIGAVLSAHKVRRRRQAESAVMGDED